MCDTLKKISKNAILIINTIAQTGYVTKTMSTVKGAPIER